VQLHDTARIGGESVQTWLADLDSSAATVGRAEDALSNDERAHFGRTTSSGARQRRTLARYALRSVLAEYLGITPASVPLVEGTNGKPGLACPGPAFNLSHSGELAAIAVCAGADALGVDIELVGPRQSSRLPMRALTATEAAWLRRRRAREKEEGFLRFWTAKEAYTKAVGTGLVLDPRSIEVRLQPHAPALVGVNPAAWAFAYLDPHPGAVGAIALRRKGGEG
jgi:4'-phosphopantetheinyl transferase